MASRAGVYVRADVDAAGAGFEFDTGTADHVGPDDVAIDLTFVDLVARGPVPSEPSDRLTSALQERAHLLSASDRVLIRWPWLAGPGREPDTDAVDAWIHRLKGAAGEASVLSEHTEVGVIQHCVGAMPVVRWSGDDPAEESRVLAHARGVETHALLRRANGIWEPPRYHYRLPNGEHVGTFVRFADAIQSPRDAFALSTWLTDRLANGMGVVADTGGLTPILLQLESFLERFDWELGQIAILEAYPAARPHVRRSVESAAPDFGDRILGLQSVSSSGSLRRTLADELQRVAESHGLTWSLDVVVDRVSTGAGCQRFAPDDQQREVSWLGLGDADEAEPSGTCNLCRDPTRAQFVAIDPRTYGEMTLPEPHRVMPDTNYAEAGHLFWERVRDVRGVAIEANPHPMSKVARGKRIALPVRTIFELIADPDGLAEIVATRWSDRGAVAGRAESETLGSTALVVTAAGDIETVHRPRFEGGVETNLEASVREVLRGLGLDPDTRVLSDHDPSFVESVSQLKAGESVLVFSWGSVTGLTLRRLKLAVADALKLNDERDGVHVNGFVLHSRPSTPREWSAVQNQFRPGKLIDLWSSCLPWESPMVDEQRLLDRAGLKPEKMSDHGRRFLDSRLGFLRYHSAFLGEEDDWSPRFDIANEGGPDPTHVFWGMSSSGVHQTHVRGRSLYGQDLDCLTAYAAIGSVIQFTRLNEQPLAAPRWVMFDMGRLVRSYFDAVILTSVIRWLRPGELWWGAERDDPDSNRDSVAYLIEQAKDEIEEQVLLFPELLLATVQGKIPSSARDLVCEKAKAFSKLWPAGEGYDIARGAVEVGLALLDDDDPG